MSGDIDRELGVQLNTTSMNYHEKKGNITKWNFNNLITLVTTEIRMEAEP